MHTAVRIEPHYKNNATVYVTDASRAVVVVKDLMDEENSQEYKADIRKEYSQLRSEYLDGLKERSFVSLLKARSRRLKTDWSKVEITEPSFLGTKVFKNFDLTKVLPYIDWDPFFSTWQIRGKYPNRTYPKIFNDKTVGEEARKLFDKAQLMLNDLLDNKRIEGRAIVGFYPANVQDKQDDDVTVYSENGEELCKFHMLRQQLD
jgi:5-methyltetrahydrofolate--homocysteine methyltransferase